MKKILVVDDDPILLDSVGLTLRARSYDVHLEDNATDAAYRFFDEPDFDAIIVDLLMPGMSGHEFLKSIRDSADQAGIPRIAISGYPGAADAAAANGAMLLLQKPFSARALVRTLEDALARSGR